MFYIRSIARCICCLRHRLSSFCKLFCRWLQLIFYIRIIGKSARARLFGIKTHNKNTKSIICYRHRYGNMCEPLHGIMGIRKRLFQIEVGWVLVLDFFFCVCATKHCTKWINKHNEERMKNTLCVCVFDCVLFHTKSQSDAEHLVCIESKKSGFTECDKRII